MKRWLPVCLFLVMAVWAVYFQALNFEFVSFDDVQLITDNPLVREGLTGAGLKWALLSAWRENVFFYPLSLISHMLDCHWFGLDPAGHHLSSIVIHSLAVVCLFLFLRRWSGALRRPALAAALFALHPLGVDSVAWVAERSNVLCAFFVLLTLLAWLSYTRPGRKSARRFGRKLWYGLALIFFVAALLAKPTAAMTPLVLIVLDRLRPGNDMDRGDSRPSPGFEALEKAPFFILAGLRVIAVLLAEKGASPVLSPEAISPALIMANALKVSLVYLGQLVYPFNLSVYYPFPEAIAWWPPAAAAAVLILITFLTVKYRHACPAALAGWLWYLIFLAPSLGVVRSGPWPAMADHYVYIPMMGLFIIIVWAGTALLERAKRTKRITRGSAGRLALPAVGLILLLYFGVISFFHVRHYENSLTLFSRAVAVTDNNFFALVGLGNAYLEQGDESAAENVFRQALAVQPDSPGVHTNLGLVLERLGRITEAEKLLQRALEISPEFIPARLGLGALYHRAGTMTTAEHHYRMALAFDPDNVAVNYNLGRLLVERGETAQAAVAFFRALQGRPDDDRIRRALEAVLVELEGTGQTGRE